MSLTHVVNTDPDNSYEPYNAANPMPVSVTGGGDASAANQTTMISHLSDIDSAVTGTLSVSDTTAQGSLATLAGAVVGSEMQVDIVSSTGTLSVSDTTAQGSLATLAGAVVGSEIQADIVSSALPTGAATSALQTSGNADLSTLAGCVDSAGSRIDVNIATDSVSLATSSLQVTGNSSLATIAGCENGANALQVDIQADAVGIASQTLQTAGNASLSTIAGDTTSMDGKMSQGSDATLASAQQVLCYGRDNGGTLDALRTDAAGHLEVVVDDFVKGQDTMSNSFPVVIASDQSTLNVEVASVNNQGSAFNAANNVTINFGAYSSVVSIANMNHLSVFYEDSSTASFDQLQIEVSPDGTNYFGLMDLYPSLEGSVRTANMTDVAVHGLTHLRLKNTSTTDNYANVKATVVGSA